LLTFETAPFFCVHPVFVTLLFSLFFSSHCFYSLSTVFVRVLFTHLIVVGIHFFPTCDGVFFKIPSCNTSNKPTWTRNSQYLCRRLFIDSVILIFPRVTVSIFLSHFPLTLCSSALLK
jgi:hypothetical protein